MNRLHGQFTGRLIAGYRALFRGAFQLIVATIFLLLVSASISLPVWFFAHSAPTAFDVLVITAIGATVVWSVIRRVRFGGKRWSFRRLVVSTFIIAMPFFMIVLALVTHSGVLALAGALLLSGVIAWRVVPA